MLLHNRSSSDTTSLLTGSLFKEPWVVCTVYQSQLQNWEVLMFFKLVRRGKSNNGSRETEGKEAHYEWM